MGSEMCIRDRLPTDTAYRWTDDPWEKRIAVTPWKSHWNGSTAGVYGRSKGDSAVKTDGSPMIPWQSHGRPMRCPREPHGGPCEHYKPMSQTNKPIRAPLESHGGPIGRAVNLWEYHWLPIRASRSHESPVETRGGIANPWEPHGSLTRDPW